MRIKEQDDFSEVMEKSLRAKVDYNTLEQYVNRLFSEKIATFSKQELQIFSDCLKNSVKEEKEFYKRLILETNGNHVQNDIFNLFENKPELLEVESFNLYSFIDALKVNSVTEELDAKLLKIRNAEQILAPYSYLFRTLQSEPSWIVDKIEKATIFESFPKFLNYHFDNEVLDSFNSCLKKENYDKALAVINRNKTISENRKNVPWIKEENGNVITCYSDGARKIKEFDKELHFENNYFLPTYISLYKQIMLSND